MRFKLFLGLTMAVILSVAAVALAGGFTKSSALVGKPCADQSCCMAADCCPECIACCAIDGCCDECILCCIEMGCDPSCCFPAATNVKVEMPKKAAAKACCGDGCCK